MNMTAAYFCGVLKATKVTNLYVRINMKACQAFLSFLLIYRSLQGE